jgi:hypothetical protein
MAALAQDLAVGAVAGYAGSRAMDRATTWYWDRMDEQAKQRERAANPDGTPLVVGRVGARLLGRGDEDGAAYRTAAQVHRGLGIAYGVAAALLARRGTPPLGAGLLAGAGAFALVDEGVLSTVLPPPTAYPPESHARGLLGHLVLGATAGAVLTVVERVTR